MQLQLQAVELMMLKRRPCDAAAHPPACELLILPQRLVHWLQQIEMLRSDAG